MKTRIMSFNIWGDYFGNPVTEREALIGDVIARYQPHILGMQEATASWNRSKLFEELKNTYAFAEGAGMPDNNFVPLLYRKDLFTQEDAGYVDYTDTPDPSKGASWAVLAHRESGKRVIVINTHFWWQKFGLPENEARRISNACALTLKALELTEKYQAPAAAMGDLNSFPAMPAIRCLKELGWRLAREEAPVTSEVSSHHGNPERGEDGRYHGKRTERKWEHSIDHILFRGEIDPQTFTVVEDPDALDASDHSPICCDFEF